MDVRTIWNPLSNRGDYMVVGGDLVAGNDVETAVLLSLFTDRRADVTDTLPDVPTGGVADRRGWWGDTGATSPIGSRLWLLDRAKGPLQVAQQAEDYAREALQWLLDDGIVARFDISAAWSAPSTLLLTVVAYRSDGTRVSSLSTSLW